MKLNLYKTYLAFLFIIVILPILAPIFLALGLESPSKIIYFIYSFTCHQFHTRSIYIFDQQYAWCARDTGIWLGWLVSAIAVYKKNLKISIFLLPIFILPIALDGGIQTIATFAKLDANGNINGEILYVSNNFFRFMTGSFFGLGIGGWISGQMYNVQLSIINENKVEKFEGQKTKDQGQINIRQPVYAKASADRQRTDKDNNNAQKTLSTHYLLPAACLLLFLIYFALIQTWALTSSRVEPTNILDTVPKVQKEGFFIRREDGSCPTQNTDPINWECFF